MASWTRSEEHVTEMWPTQPSRGRARPPEVAAISALSQSGLLKAGGMEEVRGKPIPGMGNSSLQMPQLHLLTVSRDLPPLHPGGHQLGFSYCPSVLGCGNVPWAGLPASSIAPEIVLNAVAMVMLRKLKSDPVTPRGAVPQGSPVSSRSCPPTFSAPAHLQVWSLFSPPGTLLSSEPSILL